MSLSKYMLNRYNADFQQPFKLRNVALYILFSMVCLILIFWSLQQPVIHSVNIQARVKTRLISGAELSIAASKSFSSSLFSSSLFSKQLIRFQWHKRMLICESTFSDHHNLPTKPHVVFCPGFIPLENDDLTLTLIIDNVSVWDVFKKTFRLE